MAKRTFYVTRDMRNPTGYGTRMLKAGDQIDLTGPQAKLFRALGAVSPSPPQTITSLARPDADGSGNLVQSTPAAPRTQRKRTARRKK